MQEHPVLVSHRLMRRARSAMCRQLDDTGSLLLAGVVLWRHGRMLQRYKSAYRLLYGSHGQH